MKIKLSQFILALCLTAIAMSALAANRNYKGENYKGEVAAPSVQQRYVQPAPPPPSLTLHDGPYVGLALGYDLYQAAASSNVSTGFSSSSNITEAANGIVGGLLTGYGHAFDDSVYFALEVFVNASRADQTDNSTIIISGNSLVSTSRLSVGPSYGIGFLPGIKVNEASLMYLRLGLNVAQIRALQSSVLNGGTVIYNNRYNWSTGFNYGFGIETIVYSLFSLRGEFTHTDYSAFTASSGIHYSPSDNQVMLSLIYHFT